jgi:hypothetical protein
MLLFRTQKCDNRHHRDGSRDESSGTEDEARSKCIYLLFSAAHCFPDNSGPRVLPYVVNARRFV